VQFGLQFEEIAEAAGDALEEGAAAGKDRGVRRPPAEHKGGTPAMVAVPVPANPEPESSAPAETTPGEEPGKPAAGGEVVRLDRFRKK
jgi:hypothetical protein